MRTDVIDTRGHVISTSAFRIERVVDYLFGLLYSLLLLRLLLEFLGARPDAGAVSFVNRISDPFYSPFRGMFRATNVDGGHIEWAIVAAIVGYLILHALIRRLIFAISTR